MKHRTREEILELLAKASSLPEVLEKMGGLTRWGLRHHIEHKELGAEYRAFMERVGKGYYYHRRQTRRPPPCPAPVGLDRHCGLPRRWRGRATTKTRYPRAECADGHIRTLKPEEALALENNKPYPKYDDYRKLEKAIRERTGR